MCDERRRTASRRPSLSASFCVSIQAPRARRRARSSSRRRSDIRRHDRNQSGSCLARRTVARFGRRSRARRRRPREPESSPRSRREPRRKAAGARLLRRRLRSSLHKPVCVPLRVRERHLRLSPRQRLALALVLLLAARLHDRNHAAIRLDDDLLAMARRLRKLQIATTAFMHRPGMGESDPLDRALADREAVVLLKLGARLREGLIGGEIDDGALQRPRTPERAHLRPSTNGRTRCFPIRYCGSRTSISPNFVCQRSFFYLGDASAGVGESPAPSPRPASRPKCATPRVPEDASPRHPLFGRVGFLHAPRRLRPPAQSKTPAGEAPDAPQRRHQRIIAQIPDDIPRFRKSIKPNLPYATRR